MFLGEERLPVVRRMILAATEEAERDALEELRVAQKEDFVSILEAMDGLPVTVRLLDPPLHEFLPDTTELSVKEATVGLSDEERTLYRAALEWREENPMLGTRGVRLGVIKARAVRDAGPRPDGGGGRASRSERPSGDRGDDPAHGRARGDGACPPLGRRRPSPASWRKRRPRPERHGAVARSGWPVP